MQDELKIRTTEGVVFALRLAGPAVRMAAWVIDAAAISALTTLLYQCLLVVGLLSPDLFQGAGIIGGFVLSIGYGIFTEWFWRGQTLGKRLLRLRVIDEEALKLQFSQIVIRNLLRFVDTIPVFYLFGGIVCVLSRKRQRLGDIAAGTIVIREERPVEPDLNQLGASKYNSLKDYPHLAARLRQRISPPEARVALQALLRRTEYQPQARVELFAMLANHFKEVVPYPPEAVEAIADEQYVRNVVEVLFQTGRAVEKR